MRFRVVKGGQTCIEQHPSGLQPDQPAEVAKKLAMSMRCRTCRPWRKADPQSRTYWAGVVAPAGTPPKADELQCRANRGLASQTGYRKTWPGLGRNSGNRFRQENFKTYRRHRFVVERKTLNSARTAPRVAIELQQIGQYALRGVQWSACRHIIPSVTNVE